MEGKDAATLFRLRATPGYLGLSSTRNQPAECSFHEAIVLIARRKCANVKMGGGRGVVDERFCLNCREEGLGGWWRWWCWWWEGGVFLRQVHMGKNGSSIQPVEVWKSSSSELFEDSSLLQLPSGLNKHPPATPLPTRVLTRQLWCCASTSGCQESL